MGPVNRARKVWDGIHDAEKRFEILAAIANSVRKMNRPENWPEWIGSDLRNIAGCKVFDVLDGDVQEALAIATNPDGTAFSAAEYERSFLYKRPA